MAGRPLRRARLAAGYTTKRNPDTRAPAGWYNAAHQRKPPRSQRYHVKVSAFGDTPKLKWHTESLERARYFADHTEGAALVEDQWAKPTPEVVYMTSPALRALYADRKLNPVPSGWKRDPQGFATRVFGGIQVWIGEKLLARGARALYVQTGAPGTAFFHRLDYPELYKSASAAKHAAEVMFG